MPTRGSRERIVARVARNEIDGQLTTNDQLFEVAVDALPGAPLAMTSRRNRERADVAEMKCADSSLVTVRSRLISLGRIPWQSFLHEEAQAGEGLPDAPFNR